MDREEAINELKAEQRNSDTEVAHSNADDTLCELLISLGFQDVVEEWIKVEKWYACEQCTIATLNEISNDVYQASKDIEKANMVSDESYRKPVTI